MCSKSCKCADCRNHEEWRSIPETADRFRSPATAKAMQRSPSTSKSPVTRYTLENVLGIAKRRKNKQDTDSVNLGAVKKVHMSQEYKRKVNLRPGTLEVGIVEIKSEILTDAMLKQIEEKSLLIIQGKRAFPEEFTPTPTNPLAQALETGNSPCSL
eukprot:TRINITY_DN14328_c0_g1_i1.p1 TRINITY_DN14328_c0_g1~~TRINITY_DN14328_c0_g1_i1.p1  ORF type:complete len:156 (+),score=22.25 TRINITY_DN14328_c0_g1_i1:295-762(+)